MAKQKSKTAVAELKSKVTSSVELITPVIAAAMMERNVHNRKFKPNVAMDYARDMKAGLWLENGQGISIADTGRVMDGQHRLWGVIESGVSIYMTVTRGVSEDTFHTLDSGVKRSGADAFGVKNIKNASIATAVSALCVRYNRNPNLLATYHAVKNGERLDFFFDNRSTIDTAVSIATNPQLKKIVNPVALAFLYWAVIELDSTDAEKLNRFVAGLRDGIGLEGNCPLHALRERLISERSGGGSMTKEYTAAFLIKAWNAFASGRTMRRLQYQQDKEGFPVLEKKAKYTRDAVRGVPE